jgi:hypothetical protein
MSAYNYPAPCAPEYKKPAGVQDCLHQARLLVKKISSSERPRGGEVAPRFTVIEGDTVLIVTLPDQDRYVAEAVTQALLEHGAKKVDFITPAELVGKDPDTFSVADGWREVELLREGKASGTLTDLLTGQGLGVATRKYLEEHPEYTSVFIDIGGGNTRKALGEQAVKYRGYWPFNNWEWFLSRANTFPLELWDEIERRIIEPLGRASEVRITDPEGTHLEFSLTGEEAKRWENLVPHRGHLQMSVLHATSGENRERRGYALDAPPVFPKVTGVLAGTSNHCGYFPRIETYFDQDRLVAVKGGGRYGDSIREMMDRYRDVHWPGYPGKGIFWFCDAALCTAVGAFRRKSDMFNSYWVYPNISERTRAGIFHLGFGSRQYGRGKEWSEFAQKYNLPGGHIHVHNYFATFEVKLSGTNHWYKIIDKGWTSAMDDPEVRALASKYGIPDRLLSYDWIPPLPGINCEGDYLKDYAPDAAAYLKKRIEENRSV